MFARSWIAGYLNQDIYIYIYIYMPIFSYVILCVCACVQVQALRWGTRQPRSFTKCLKHSMLTYLFMNQNRPSHLETIMS
jgi:hypothetical protein